MTCSSWARQRLSFGLGSGEWPCLSEIAIVFLLDWENVIGLIVYSTKKQTGSWEPGYQEQLELWCEHINLNSFGLEGLVCKLWQMMNTKSRCASPYLYIRIQDGQIRPDTWLYASWNVYHQQRTNFVSVPFSDLVILRQPHLCNTRHNILAFQLFNLNKKISKMR